MSESRYAQLDPRWSAVDASPVHFIGIGGAGMSVIAQMFNSLGAQVSGSDSRQSDVTEALKSEGIRVGIPQSEANIDAPKTVVVSSAIRDDNPELVAARLAGATIIHRSQALALLMRGRRAIAVAGAHGKTTTSAMIAVASQAAGWDPSFAIGGSVRTEAGSISGGAVGRSDILVAEADESDGSFLNYEPHVAVITNIEPDHLDHYGSREAFEQAFVEFASRVHGDGCIVACADDSGALALATELRSGGRRVVTYGVNPQADVVLSEVVQPAGESTISFSLSYGDQIFDEFPASDVRLSLRVPGVHNALNAAGAFAALVSLGAAPGAVVEGLNMFLGTGRRFDPRGSVDDIRVVDDYAHHPTEVEALLKAARLSAGAGRVIVLFQPHLYSRTRIFAREFAQAFDLADHTVLTAIYAAREDHDPATSSEMIANTMAGSVEYVSDRFEAAARVVELAQPGDLILTVGAGDVTELGPVIVEGLVARGN